jgi:ribonuclease BN (tRNA processing enzyme)
MDPGGIKKLLCTTTNGQIGAVVGGLPAAVKHDGTQHDQHATRDTSSMNGHAGGIARHLVVDRRNAHQAHWTHRRLHSGKLDDMHADTSLAVTPVGVGAAYGRPGEHQSCYLVTAGTQSICLDLGAGAFNALCAITRPEDIDLFVMSHLHPDHFIDLLALRVYMVWGPGAGHSVRVAGPPGLREVLAAFGEDGLGTAMQIEVLVGVEAATQCPGALEITHRQVPHLPPTYATRISFDGRSVCFGADCAPNDALPEFASGVDVLLTECSFGETDIPLGAAHLNAHAAGDIARRAGAGQLLLAHCFPEYDIERSAQIAAEVAGIPVAPARQGQTVQIL